MQNQKLSMATKIGYGVGSLGQGVAYIVFQLYFLFYLTDFVGVAPAIAGTISLVAVLWDAVTDPIIGSLSDHSNNPKGKRRPFILKLCIPFGITLFLMFTDWSVLGADAKIGYFFIVNILFWLFFTSIDIPYMTLGGEITDDNSEKIGLRSIATIFFYIGFLIASSGTMVLLEKFAALAGGDHLKGWSLVGITFGIIVTISYLIAVIATNGKEKSAINTGTEDTGAPKVNIFKSMMESLKVKPYFNLWFYNFFLNLAIVFATSAVIYVYIYFIGFNQNQISMAFVIYTIFVFIFSPIVGKISTKIGNRKALLWTVSLLIICFFAFKIIPLNQITVYILQIFIALGNVGFYVNSYTMVYEVSEYSSLKTGFKNDGVLMAFYQFSYKLGAAVAMWLVGVSLTFYQYDPTAEALSDVTMNGLRNMNTLIPGVLCLLTIPFVLKYSLTPKNIKRLDDILKAKEEGKEINMDEIKEIL